MAPQVFGELLGGGIPALGLLAQRLEDDRVEVALPSAGLSAAGAAALGFSGSLEDRLTTPGPRAGRGGRRRGAERMTPSE